MKYLNRYQSGDYSAWDDLVALGPTAASDPLLYAEAGYIAQLIMERVRDNVAILRHTLTKAGARLGENGSRLKDSDLVPFEERFGPLPVSLAAFYKTIGSINLTPVKYDYGRNKLEKMDGIALVLLDPLQIWPADELNFLIDEYDDPVDKRDMPFAILLCPDFLHKANVSGGEPYSIVLESLTLQEQLDPIVSGTRKDISFVNYLRRCIRFGGFPGLDVIEDDDKDVDVNRQMAFSNVARPWKPACQRLLGELCQGLVSF